MARGRTYTPEERAAAVSVARAEQNELATARKLKIPRPTLQGWTGSLKAKGRRLPAKVDEESVQEHGKRYAEGLDVMVTTLIERLGTAAAEVPLESAKDVRDAAVAMGIGIEKHSFALGGPTNRTASVQVQLIAPTSLADAARAIAGDTVPALPEGHKD